MAAKQVQWGRVRQSYMAGMGYKDLSQKYGVSVKTIQNRASKEGWVKEKGKIREEVGEKIHARIVRVRVAELEKLAGANSQLIDALVHLTNYVVSRTKDGKMDDLFDKAGSMKNTENLARAIQTAIQSQQILYKLPTLDQDMRKKEAAQRKREMKAKLDLEREKWEAEKAKAENEIEADTEVWKIVAPEGVTVDG